MPACPDELELLGFLRRDLDASRVRWIEEHFDTCTECRHLTYALATASDEAAPHTALEPGALVGRYAILARIAEGAMGVVYRARDTTLGRDVALKVLRARGRLVPDASLRMLREARGLARLDHPSVVTVFEAGLHAGAVYIAMELVEGAPLDRWLDERRPSRRAILAVLAQVGRGLMASHAAGLVHRDVKPANVMIATDGRAKLIDFGLVRDPGAGRDESGEAEPGGLAAAVTRTGTLVGTPAYCAPEQLAGDVADARGDVFAFAVMCCETLTGQRPFTAPTIRELRARMQAGALEAAALPARPRGLRRAIVAALAIDRERRAASVAGLIAALEPPGVRRSVVVGAALTLAVAGALTGRAWPADEPCGTADAELATTWNLARRHAVGAAILATGAGFAHDTWERVAGRLDRYADDWTAHHVQACRATAVEHTQSDELLDRRMACLARRRTELAATVDALVAIQRSNVGEAVRIADGLVAIESCRDATTLIAITPPPLATAAAVEIARRELAQVWTRHRAGDDVTAYEQATQLAVRVAQLGYRPLVAEAEHALAVMAGYIAETKIALEREQDAVASAAAVGDAELEARALGELAIRVALIAPEERRGYAHAQHAVSIATRIAARPAVMAALYLAEAQSLSAIDRAASRHVLGRGRQAVAQAQAEGDGLGEYRVLYAVMEADLEDTATAKLDHMRTALALAEATYGPTHPRLLGILEGLRGVAHSLGRDDEARGYAARMVALTAATAVATTLALEALAANETDEEARRVILESLVTALERARGAGDPVVADALVQLSDCLTALRRGPEAAAAADRAIAILEAQPSGYRAELVGAYASKAQSAVMFDLATAERAANRAVQLVDDAAVLSPVRLVAYMVRVMVSFEQRRFADVLRALVVVRPLIAQLLPAEDIEVLPLTFIELASRWELGQDRPAMLRRARAINVRYQAEGKDESTKEHLAAWLDGKR